MENKTVRQIIKIDSEKCNGCSLCVTACHEGAITMKDGKATLLRDDYCDGLGDCLPACPTNAITFETREALVYDEAAVLENMKKAGKVMPTGCPGSQPMTMQSGCPGSKEAAIKNNNSNDSLNTTDVPSELTMWPVQLQLVAPNAQFFNGSDVVLAADCCAYAYGNFHADFMKDKVTLIACPKLDDADYFSKLVTILESNDVKSITIVRMEVPCCGGLSMTALRAFEAVGKDISCKVVILTRDGKVASEEVIA